MLLQIHQKITGEIFFTGALAVHRWCGEILKYRTLATLRIYNSIVCNVTCEEGSEGQR